MPAVHRHWHGSRGKKSGKNKQMVFQSDVFLGVSVTLVLGLFSELVDRWRVSGAGGHQSDM